ncbi:head-tail connector protein [Sphingomonas leidyi]|uniref:head-tail connector protein n=1 Tax=Sphingomonas leidyi TaxID=68569 RepID=UPI0036D3DF71
MDEPITLSEAKAQLRIDGTASDAMVTGYIAAAREWIEGETGVLLVEREVTETLRVLGPRASLRSRPINAAEPVRVAYFDRAGAEQVITDAIVINPLAIDVGAPPPRLALPAAGAWPATNGNYPVTVTFTAGINDPTAIPPVMKAAMMMLITAYEASREGGDLIAAAEASARRLCRQYIRKAL